MSTPITPTQAAELLRVLPAALRAEFAALPAALSWHPAPGEWCLKEVLGHLIEAEQRGFAGRIRSILAGESPQLEAWDQQQVARERRDCERDPVQLLAEFARLREASVALAAGLKGSDLQRGGHHPKVGFLRVGDLLHEWVHHDRNHLRQILANVQAFVWPHMGSAQRFSD
ncbi:MAG: DinB family protein [Candidatus Rokubacteria bacterium]|nr:DinB family protein [Candidatus Rokubacteria bacterium]